MVYGVHVHVPDGWRFLFTLGNLMERGRVQLHAGLYLPTESLPHITAFLPFL